MKKDFLSIGIIFLFILSAISPIVISYNLKISNEIVSEIKSDGGLMDSAWPITGHDVHHTCRSSYGSPGNYIVEKWKVLLDKPGHYYCSPVIAEDGTIYVVSGISYDTLYAIDPNGTIKWKYVTTGQLVETLYTPAIAEDGTIYVKSDEEEFYAFNTNGTIKCHHNKRRRYVYCKMS